MAGYKGVYLATLAIGLFHGGSASLLQKPLFSGPQLSPPDSPASTSEKPLVDSEALQATISSERLLKRAKDLYEVAELSLDEYNRPTRVIGSAGKSPLLFLAPESQYY